MTHPVPILSRFLPQIPAKRFGAVDAARGYAIVFACLSHLKGHFVDSAPRLHWWLETTTRIATPTFLLLSGFVIGHLLRTDRFGNRQITLLDRGLFLLMVGHVLLSLSDVTVAGRGSLGFVGAVITDALGIATFAAVLLRTASAVTLTALGITLCLGSWWLAMTLTVQGGWPEYVGAFLFGMPSTAGTIADSPVVPYLGVFLIGMALSSHLKPVLVAGLHSAAARRIAFFGLGAILLAVIAALGWHFGKSFLPEGSSDPEVAKFVRSTLNPRSKRPPSPAYLLVYGGMGLLMLSVFFRGRPRWLLEPVIRAGAVIGRASLLCFIVQDWLLFVIPWLFGFLHFQSIPFWFAYLALCFVVLYALALWWGNIKGNRLLTVGLKALARRRRERALRVEGARAPQPSRGL